MKKTQPKANIRMICVPLLTVMVLLAAPGVIGAEDAHDEEPGKAGPSDVHHGEEGEEAQSGLVGPGKAVEGFEHGKRIRLSARAVTRLEIRTGRAEVTGGRMTVPVEALVAIKDRYFVFVARGGWFEYRRVRIGSRDASRAVLDGGIGVSEDIVLKGAGILRLVELDIEAGEKGGAHSH
jgi:hypothetical protein